MTTTLERPRILTDNEKYGSGVLDEHAPGGVWVVLHNPGPVALIADSRQVAEDYIYAKCAESPTRTPNTYSLQVWAITSEWPEKES